MLYLLVPPYLGTTFINDAGPVLWRLFLCSTSWKALEPDSFYRKH